MTARCDTNAQCKRACKSTPDVCSSKVRSVEKLITAVITQTMFEMPVSQSNDNKLIYIYTALGSSKSVNLPTVTNTRKDHSSVTPRYKDNHPSL